MATTTGWVYLVLDLYARRVVGWAVRDTPAAELAVAAMTMALQARRPAPGLIHHSDRGSQYASHADQAQLARANVTPSMSRTGNCWDNAVMERCFATLKMELGDPVFADLPAARSAVFDDIERFYHRQRLHATLTYQTPLAAEDRWARQSATG